MKLVPLKDFCKMYQPPTISTKEMIPDGEFVVYGANGPIGRYNKFNHEEPQLLVTCRGATCGAVNMSEPFAWINGNAMVIQPDLKLATLEYMKYAFLGGIDVSSSITGSAQPQITRTTLEVIKVPLPSLEKQREIVEKLDSAFAEIEDAKMRTTASLQNLSKFLDSKFEEVFTILEAEFGVVQSGTIIDVRDGTHDSPSYVDSGYPLITSKNLQDGLIDFSKVSLISEEDYQQINKRSKVEAGDLLFAMIGTIGNPVVVKEDPLFAIKNVALFKGNPSYDMTFLSFYLRTPKVREKFEREAKGTTQRFLGLGYLRTLDIPNVSPENQFEIVRKLEQFESEIKKLKLNLKQRLENYKELNISILSSMFTIDSEEEAVA
jgi:type I restriction enzyme S subunit